MPTSPMFAAQTFVNKWGKVTINEKATAQTHFIALCALLGVDAPLDVDPTGAFYRFEKPLTKVGGGAGFADVWRKDRFAWEYKSVGKYPTLKAAYQQLLMYKENLDNPPTLVACDIANYEVHVSYTGYETVVRQFTNADLVNAETREFLRLAMIQPTTIQPASRPSPFPGRPAQNQ